jgi:hypothetical protein
MEANNEKIRPRQRGRIFGIGMCDIDSSKQNI